MKLSGLLSRPDPDLPGVTGIARVDRRTDALLRRVGPGDIAVLDQVDIDRASADVLVRAGVTGVVDASPAISGRFPSLGPAMLVGAGMVLIDGVGTDALRTIRDGMRIRLHDGVIYTGGRELARGNQQTEASVADLLVEAKAGMSAQLEAFSANTIEFLRRERTLILDGVGVPTVRTPIAGRQVLVVAPGPGHAGDLRALRRYIAEHQPVLIAVGVAADTLREQGYRPDLIVGDPDRIATDILCGGAEVVIPAHMDGHAPGLERIQDLGIGAVTFPASGNADDLALLLADAHGASLVVTVGFHATLAEFLDRGRSGSNPSTFLTRLKLGARLVDGTAVATLSHSRVSVGVVALLVLTALVAVVVAVAVSGVSGPYLDWMNETWIGLLAWTRGVLG